MSTLTAFYDLAVGPVSFDFAVFLVKAEMTRSRVGAKRLHVVFVPDPNGPGGFRDKRPYFDEHEARWRFANICIPACALMGATHTVALDWAHATAIRTHFARQCGRDDWVWPPDWNEQSRKNRRHLVGDVIRWARAGEPVPRFSASEEARRAVREWYARMNGRPKVTITLRKTYLDERNSDEALWRSVANQIGAHGVYAVVLRDTRTALAKGGYGELNLDLRMACYQEAALNLQANNGAASLCWFSGQPYRMFGAGDEHWDGLFVKQGLPLGESWPWALPQQKLCYGKETFEQVMAEVAEWAKAAPEKALS